MGTNTVLRQLPLYEVARELAERGDDADEIRDTMRAWADEATEAAIRWAAANDGASS